MSNSRYLAEEINASKYFYAGIFPPVLKNKLNIKQAEELAKRENEIIMINFPLRPILTKFTLQEIQTVHYSLFRDIYDWAGKLRDYTTGRGNVPFARPEMIESFYHKQIFLALQQENYLQNCAKSKFIKKSAYFINEFNAIHPFIDGNERLTRIFLQDLALNVVLH
ncbi:Fic/DOC family protein [Volucribacter amazonae]|uniref:protein adenylyltransferase n=1 Tax=Volucribacter amazonae TaxID=256731 RepID=A0A9X4PCM6_9PAST|nr:Fic family protein [Volucribacter amazonae]MDG6895712.1 hypothetical protein [Volucribacter amazonae]